MSNETKYRPTLNVRDAAYGEPDTTPRESLVNRRLEALDKELEQEADGIYETLKTSARVIGQEEVFNNPDFKRLAITTIKTGLIAERTKGAEEGFEEGGNLMTKMFEALPEMP